MAGDLDTLIEFGFTEAKAKKALKVTKNSGLQPALDWLEAHPEDEGEDDGGDENDDNKMEEDAVAAEVEAKSLKCVDCGKIFKNQALASYHGDKSGHQNFEESTEEVKPLTEEEKKQKLEELRAKMAEKKAAQAKIDAEENKRNEMLRRKGGKEMASIKEETQKKIAEQDAAKARREKVEEAKAKAKVRAEIEADKKARAEKAAREKAIREGKSVVDPEPKTPTPVASSSSGGGSGSAPKRDNKETRLQIRLPPGQGQPLVTTLPSESTLQNVAEYVTQNSDLTEPIKFSIPFPRKTFADEDRTKTLVELDLVPSSVLIIAP